MVLFVLYPWPHKLPQFSHISTHAIFPSPPNFWKYGTSVSQMEFHILDLSKASTSHCLTRCFHCYISYKLEHIYKGLIKLELKIFNKGP